METGATRGGLRWLAIGFGVLVVVEVLLAAGFAAGAGWSWGYALTAFVPTNAAMGVAFGLCGAIIGWHRPRNAIGWLFLADGLGHATSAVAAPLLQVLHDADAPVVAQRVVITVFGYAWPWSIGLFLPLALLLFPDGRPLSPRWRPVIIAVVVTAPLFVLYMGAGPEPVGAGIPLTGYLTIAAHASLQPLWTLAEVRHVLLVALAILALVLRYRRADEAGRRQLLWLVLATIVLLGVSVPWGFVAGTPIVVLFAIPLIPVAVTVAIIRHRLLDIRLVVSRAVAWLLASAGAVVVYVALVALLDSVVSERLGRSALATVIVALLLAPVLPRLQALVDRAMYGDRRDPAAVVSRIGQRLVTDESALGDVVDAVRDALRVPYVAVRVGDRTPAESGTPQGPTGAVPLIYGGERRGELVVGLRPGERTLSDADRDALTLIAIPLATAVHATQLSAELQASRESLVLAREDERRRLRRDLHDGLGPALTGIALAADAAANHLPADPERAGRLLDTLRSDTRAAIADVRRIVDDLRPPALDDFGLLGALRQHAERTSQRADGHPLRVELLVPGDVPELPAAVESAGYRIVAEALNNVVRHSRATSATVRISYGDTLDVEVADDGPPNGAWRPGIGLRAMAERAAELGGRFEAGPTATGGRVSVVIPLEQT